MPVSSAPARVPFVSRLEEYGDAPALLTADGVISYGELAGRVADAAERLGTERRLSLLPMRNDVDSVVAYLGALAGSHPVLLTEDRADLVSGLVDRYDPDVVGRDGDYEERRPGTAHELHPDLALLLSTSGSTGSPRLVRLGADGLQHNADAIAEYLALRHDDVAVTTLPLHYCYGLSVLHSHLAVGAAVCLTDLSVVDACFWDLVREQGVTSLAGVPHTFDLLDRVGFDGLDAPSLRRLTVAGGRLAPERVRHYAERGQRRGFDMYVMYGQTEATARIAWLPPDLAITHPGAIGVPVPGGSMRIDTENGGDVGELVYSGPNVMLGYAETPADLGRGREIHELRTGDLARTNDAGLVEIVGRTARMAKLFGLRIDLDQLEQRLTADGVHARCAATDERLVVGVAQGRRRRGTASRTTTAVADITGLPGTAVSVVVIDAMPLLSTGKPDYRALAALAPSPEEGPDDVAGLYRRLLGRTHVGVDDSFASLGGDSLSYVEVSVRLERLLGHLPTRWHLRPVAELEDLRRDSPRRTRAVDTSVVLRAMAIVAIVGSHSHVFALQGGAHVLLALAGFNVGRFQLTSDSRHERWRGLLQAARRVAVPSMLWISLVALVTGALSWYSPFLLNAAIGTREWSEPAWFYWFIEALVALLLLTAALLAVPWIHRAERRWPFWLPVALAVVGLLFRYELLELRGGVTLYRAENVLWLFALGWAAARATSHVHRLVVSVLVLAVTPGFVDDVRAAVIVAGVLALVWLPHVRVPAPVARVCATLAAASLAIYLTHWQVYLPIRDEHPYLAFALALGVGLAVWAVSRWVRTHSALVRRVTG